MARRLRTDVYVAGLCYEAGSTPDDDIARKITNPLAWEDDVTSPVPNSNDTSHIGDGTRVVAEPPPGPSGGPEPRPAANPADTAGEEQTQEFSQGEARLSAPPRSGRGSGTDAWEAFANVHGVDLPPDADRSEIIAACERAGLVDPA